MENLIEVINRLQDVFNVIGEDGVDLPQIIVLGVQSAGKSSVLENIVGRDFLPRGQGMVTKRPLILQLIRTRHDSIKGSEFTPTEEYGQFLHQENKRFTFPEIREEIIQETSRLLQNSNNVSKEPIRLRIYSPRVVNLTLVDLPGLTKIPIGDQPENIEEQIYQLVLDYVKNPNSIILAVISANVDIATSDALKIVAKVDPKGERTIIALTKVDLLDKGTNAYDVLTKKNMNMNFIGIIGVLNRSQLDNDKNISMNEMLRREKLFFSMNYPDIAEFQGTEKLISTLQEVLISHIRCTLPDLKIKTNAILQKLKSNSKIHENENMDKSAIMLDLAVKFTSEYIDVVSGNSEKFSSAELCGGARIYYIFFEMYGKDVENIDPLDGLDQKQIITAIRNSMGFRTAIFAPERAFEDLIRIQIRKLLPISLNCVDVVHKELIKITRNVIKNTKELGRYQVLRDSIDSVLLSMLNSQKEPTIKMVKSLIKIESYYINTNHPDFEELKKQIHENNEDDENTYDSKQVEKINKENPEVKCAQMIEKLIKSYFTIMKKKIQDNVVKTVSYFLIHKISKRVRWELVHQLQKSGTIEHLMRENPREVEERRRILLRIEALKKAQAILSDVMIVENRGTQKITDSFL